MDIETIERELRLAIEEARGNEWEIRSGAMFVHEKACCALGALVRGYLFSDENEAFYAAVEKLGISPDQGTALARGFDGLKSYPGIDERLYFLGLRLAQDYLNE